MYYIIQEVNNKDVHQTARSAPLLFAYGINRFSHDVAHIHIVAISEIQNL